jgi:hypothetical protein
MKAHIRDGELRIPLSDEVREKLAVHEGEELDAHVFEGSVTFTRTTAEARRQAGGRILELIENVRLRPGQPPMSSAEVDDLISQEAANLRRIRRQPRE